MRRLLLTLTTCLALGHAVVAQEPYRLGAGDRLRVDVFEQPTLTREMVVQSDGTVRLPRIGSLGVDGLTLDEAADRLSSQLKTALGLMEPDVTVEILVYRPIYITGDVETPGAYPYAPGMTLLNAIALAGGYYRPELGDATARLEEGRLMERLEQLRDQLAISHVRLSRLAAERDGRSQPAAPPEIAALVTSARAAELQAQETATMVERMSSLDGTIGIFNQRREQLRNEITALEAQKDAKIEQVAILRKEAASIEGLLAQGLVPASRGYELQRTIVGVEADRREIEAFVARARGAIAEVDQAELNLRSERLLDILTGIKNALDEIAQQTAAIASVGLQLETARRVGSGLNAQDGGLSFDEPMVKRRHADDFVPISLVDLLEPDDLVAIPSSVPRR